MRTPCITKQMFNCSLGLSLITTYKCRHVVSLFQCTWYLTNACMAILWRQNNDIIKGVYSDENKNIHFKSKFIGSRSWLWSVFYWCLGSKR